MKASKKASVNRVRSAEIGLIACVPRNYSVKVVVVL